VECSRREGIVIVPQRVCSHHQPQRVGKEFRAAKVSRLQRPGQTLTVSVFIPFRSLFHADWSTVAKKRWVASAMRIDSGWQMTLLRPVRDTRAFVNELFTGVGPLLAGFDFPIGVPAVYGQLTGLADFSTALEVFGKDEWSEFFLVAETPQQVSRKRPFYPRAYTAASKPKQIHLLHGLRIESIDVRAPADCDHRFQLIATKRSD
jgi:hypothetical protein